MPRVQGVQGGLPGLRRHRVVQGGVPRPLVRGAPPAAGRLCDGSDRRLGPAGGAGPVVANGVSQTPPLAAVLKRAAGLAPERDLPRFAPTSFVKWVRRRGTAHDGGTPVVLWADTFTNAFHPSAGQAAVEVLEASGFRVRVPSGRLCCGRPLYDFGMLDRARRYLRQVLDALRADLRAGLAVVVLEPSCLAVFKDELGQLFPDDEDARRLRDQSMLLSQLLLEHAPSFEPTPLGRRAPCTRTAISGRWSASSTTPSFSPGSASRPTIRTPAAVVSPAPSATSGASTTTSR